jgi:hypothetical protein
MSFTGRVLGGVIVMAALLTGRSGGELLPAEMADLVAARLVQEQVKEGPDQGAWPSETLFMGPTIAGMVSAYEWTGQVLYWASAELAGDYVLWMGVNGGNLLGDEAYALMRLSEISDDPQENLWRTALADFYESPRLELTEGTTEEYIAFFGETDPSTAVFYLAHHAMAANYVDDLDKDIWRSSLIRYLSRVDDRSLLPVMALGAATWSLAATGALDETPVIAPYDYEASSLWEGVALRDLPSLLLTHQVPNGEFFAGSFYWRFDHSDGGTGGVAAGYTEDTVFGALGLVGAAAQDSNSPHEEIDKAIAAAREILLEAIDDDGCVYAHLSRQGQAYNAFAGEMLQVLWSIEQYQGRRKGPDVEVSVAPKPQ